jgi:hypothetical protein
MYKFVGWVELFAKPINFDRRRKQGDGFRKGSTHLTDLWHIASAEALLRAAMKVIERRHTSAADPYATVSRKEADGVKRS